MDNKRRKVFVIKQSNWCRFMLKMHQNTFGGRTLPGPTWGGGLCAPPDPQPQWGPISKGRERKEGRRPTSKGDGRELREARGDGKGGKGIPPK